MKGLKNVALFVGGAAVGFIGCGAIVCKLIVKSDIFLEAFREWLTSVIKRWLFGDDAAVQPQTHKVSYRPYRETINFYLDEVLFTSYATADNAMGELQSCLNVYGVVTLGDLKKLANIPVTAGDRTLGWHNIDDAKILRVRGGWTIGFPRPKQIV